MKNLSCPYTFKEKFQLKRLLYCPFAIFLALFFSHRLDETGQKTSQSKEHSLTVSGGFSAKLWAIKIRGSNWTISPA